MEEAETGKAKDNLVTVPPSHWDDIEASDLARICELSLARPHPPEGVSVRVLNRDILVDIQQRCLKSFEDERDEALASPLLELITLVYLMKAAPVLPSQELISVHELKDALFFQGPHALPLSPLIERYGHDLHAFRHAASALGGEPVDFADAAYRFHPFPKIPICFLLWKGDEEFEPSLSVLFDRSIERHLAADAILGVVNLVVNALLGRDKRGRG